MNEKYFRRIEEEVKKNSLKVDIDKIKNALLLAEESHRGQYRKSGEDYIVHPVEVTRILINLKVDTDTIVAGILHDIVEDTLITIADIKYNFGDNVAELVDGVTKLKNLPVGTKQQYENLRKMILAMSKNINVVIIKLADRLHNMRTLMHMKPEKQISIAKETLDIYAPLAHRLGMGKIKCELEDLSLMYLHPKEYLELKNLINVKKNEREGYIENIITTLTAVLKSNDITFDISGRAKHFYSIYKKMYEGGKAFDDIYDLMGIRIITKSKTDCYHILGIIQSEFVPVPGRFKDYISVPKSNNYQSIHTTIIGPNGKFVEIQIRTEEMDKVAEEGIAAHWNYKEKVAHEKGDNLYSWIREIIENQQQENSTSEEFVNIFKEDLMKEEVFVFSPKGDVVKMTNGATTLDFAFHIHSNIGISCIGGKVNGRIVPLDHKLKNGDRVEIITSKNAKGPGKDWLNIVVTHVAKSKIKKWIKDQKFEESSKLGKSLIEEEIEKFGLTLREFEENSLVRKYMEKHNLSTMNDFYFHIGENRGKLEVISDKLKEKYDLEKKATQLHQEIEEKNILETLPKKNSGKKNDYGIVIDGVNNTLLKFAKCCTPLPGDEVGGYVTKITGITVHRKDCPNYINMIKSDPGREIEVSWDPKLVEKKSNKYRFNFMVIASDRMGLIMDIVTLVANHKINLLSINSTDVNSKEGLIKIRMSIEISNKNEYKYLVNNILKLKDVISVDRE